MRPNVYKFGKLIQDVTTDPATKRTVESHARAFDASNDPQYTDDFTATSSFTGEKIHRWNGMMETLDDIIANSKLKRWMYRFNGSCNGGVCVGWNAQNVMWNVTAMIDKDAAPITRSGSKIGSSTPSQKGWWWPAPSPTPRATAA